MQTIISRKDARAQGLKRYFTGKPCKRGHIAERYVSQDSCMECGTNTWNLKHPEHRLAKASEWKAKNPDKAKIHKSRYLAKASVRDAARVRARAYYATNKEKVRQYYLGWMQRNEGRVSALNAARRSRQYTATPKWADRTELARFYAARPEGYHVDHIIPLRHPLVSGLHVLCNLQYLPAADNLRKHNHFEIV